MLFNIHCVFNNILIIQEVIFGSVFIWTYVLKVLTFEPEDAKVLNTNSFSYNFGMILDNFYETYASMHQKTFSTVQQNFLLLPVTFVQDLN